MSARSLRWGLLAGPAFVVITNVGNPLALSGLTDGTTDADALSDLHRLHTINDVGVVLEVLGFMLLFFFIPALYRVLRRAEAPDGWLAGAALMAGTVMVATKMGSGAFEVAGRYHPAAISAQQAGTLADLADAAFVVSGLFMAMFVLTAAMSGRGSRLLPGWATWSGIVFGVTGVAAPLAAIHDPNSYVPIPFLLSLLWLAVIAILLTRRVTQEERAPFVPTTHASAVRAST